MERLNMVMMLNSDYNINVLHVDDNEDFREIFQLMFGEWMEITSAEDGIDALEKLDLQQFDAVVTDYDMPNMNGLELLQKVQGDYPDMPMILYTGQGNEKIAREAFVSGAADYFTKNLTEFAHKEKMINSVKKAVRNRRVVERVRKTEERFKTVFHKMPVGIAVINMDGMILEINQSACRIVGYQEEEMLGERCSDYLCARDLESCPILKGGKAVDRCEECVRNPAGEEVSVLKSSTLIEFGGEMVVMEVMLDVSETRQTEKDLQENIERFSSLTNELSIGNIIIKNKRIVHVNDVITGQTGYSYREMLSWRKKEYLKIIHPEDRFETSNLVESQLDKSDYAAPWSEMRIITKDGAEKKYKIQAKKSVYKGDDAVEIVTIDITDTRTERGKSPLKLLVNDLIRLPFKSQPVPGNINSNDSRRVGHPVE